MVRSDHDEGIQSPTGSVAEGRRGARKSMPRPLPRTKENLHRELAQRYDIAHPFQGANLLLKIRLAPRELDPRRLVLRRRASNRCCDIAIAEGKTVILRDGRWLVREARPEKGAEQPVPAPVPREHPPGPVSSMGRGCQAHDEKSRVGISEAWEGTAPVFPVPEPRHLPARHSLAIPHEARAGTATDDAAVRRRNP